VNDKVYRSNAIELFFGKEAAKTFSSSDFWTDPFHPDDVEKIKESLDKAIKNPDVQKWKFDYRIINQERGIVYVIDQGVIVRDAKGNAIRMVGAMADITEQKLFENENTFKANLLKRIGQAAVSTDLCGTINYWSKAAEDIYGWNAEEVIGKKMDLLIPNDLNELEVAEISQILENGKTWSGEFQVQKKDGNFFPVRVTNAPVYDDDNKLVGMIGISSDISKERENQELLKRYTQDLERSNEELEQFAYVASHDLQEPLRMISSFMEQLKRKYGNQLDEKAHQYIHFATDGAKRMRQIILDILEYSKVSSPIDLKEIVNVNQVVTEYKLLRKKLISEKSVRITFPDLPILHIHKVGITQILHALLDNAIKYSKQEGSPIIEINAVERQGHCLFSVKDNGIGIDTQYSEKIFLIFQRIHNPNISRGTGIGLSTAKKHVELMGGKIWVESRLGEGATFYFTIPKSS
ncbi:PAS domain S-box-containing protein, partial [Algoriphagus faecimaris]